MPLQHCFTNSSNNTIWPSKIQILNWISVFFFSHYCVNSFIGPSEIYSRNTRTLRTPSYLATTTKAKASIRDFLYIPTKFSNDKRVSNLVTFKSFIIYVFLFSLMRYELKASLDCINHFDFRIFFYDFERYSIIFKSKLTNQERLCETSVICKWFWKKTALNLLIAK